MISCAEKHYGTIFLKIGVRLGTSVIVPIKIGTSLHVLTIHVRLVENNRIAFHSAWSKTCFSDCN